MRRTLTGLALASVLMTTISAQHPGDRPAANPRSTRSVVVAQHGMIATSQPLASAAGLRVLQEGGNAIDAAVTAAAVLAVVEPTMNGIGGDLFALVYDAKTGRLGGLNSSGRAGAKATPQEFARRGLTRIPGHGPLAITVPGTVAGWAELLRAHGTITLARALAPAIAYARDGFPVAEIVAGQWKNEEKELSQDPWAANTFLVAGHAPRAGEVFRNPRLARSLDAIASGGADAFYKGELAQAIVADLDRRDGLLTRNDFATHTADWVAPISTNYRGVDLYELPPNTQGFVALEMLNLLEGYDVKAMGHNSADYLHVLAEAKRIAFADRGAYLADPAHVPDAVLRRLLSKPYAAERRHEISLGRAAADYKPGAIGSTPGAGALDFAGRDLGDTIYLTAADGQGNVVSFIQSLFDSFGSGVVAGDTGIVLHNRGSGFTLQAGHPNQVAAGKRPLHTLVPAMAFRDGKPWVSFGVMGGDMQGQGHAQVIVNLVDFGMNIQEAGEAARVRHMGTSLAVESAIPASVRDELRRRGHTIVDAPGAFGGFQGIMIDWTSRVLMGGSDPRKDGLAIGF